MRPKIRSPIPKNITPTFGWYHNHAAENAIIHNGMHTINAAKNITNPTVPFRMPPIKGMTPKIAVIGAKNIQIPKTIMKNDATLIIQVISCDFLTALSIISFLLRIYYSTKFIS